MKALNSTALVTSVLPPLGIAAAVTGFLVINENELSGFAITVVSVAYFWSALWLYGAVNNTYNVFYDDKFVYLKGYFREHQIPFGDVSRVQLTTDKQRILGFTSRKYKIVFASHTRTDDQYFWDVEGAAADEFGAALKLHNDDVMIVHHS